MAVDDAVCRVLFPCFFRACDVLGCTYLPVLFFVLGFGFGGDFRSTTDIILKIISLLLELCVFCNISFLSCNFFWWTEVFEEEALRNRSELCILCFEIASWIILGFLLVFPIPYILDFMTHFPLRQCLPLPHVDPSAAGRVA